MPCNVGKVERLMRVLLGILLLGIATFADMRLIATATALLVGSIALVTGTIGYCPIWTLLGLDTCPVTDLSNTGRKL